MTLDRFARLKEETKMNRSLELMKYSHGLVLWESGLTQEFIISWQLWKLYSTSQEQNYFSICTNKF
ncbi:MULTISPECIES: hypothetical protein [Metallosphaera]|uniref:Uncharacterized protein n=2 Tax=Metallosphaera TaxID=41980 RepID=A0A0K1SVZ1_9CREN|nr:MULTISPECIES: hypothetical protein [Metallosphaera]AKV74232.1 hypothetical protein MsedA_1223 [Metallosphaera sedula]AKV76471.1 hypothetical protein MsedB_1225 [Metallosphaera sedula]AKV78723.1 hypothetical protein MsedC_1223 [Metallosphaera sedula]AKV80968.1 hypothetical protein MsedD_1224 [Metallosphaera sedula]MCY0861343.1 hypothetical protein [Metallosphaera prunae]